MMSVRSSRPSRRLLRWSLTGLAVLSVAVAGAGYLRASGNLEGWLVRKPVVYPWKSISKEEVAAGVTVPADTNVVFHLPDTGFERIVRETLFGLKGKRVRYWGYCFPANYDPARVETRTGFQGIIFLSEQERIVRAEQERRQEERFSINNLPTAEEIARMEQRKAMPIRHQLEVFEPSMLCYIMSEESLALGLDPDGDRLNNRLEAELQTDPTLRDTDGDGISDGVEHLSGTIPTMRDTDGDGLIDGIEDKDWDGFVDPGETDPRNSDTDRDGLCDGMCRVQLKSRAVFMGEDKNLNGVVDEGETDPTKWDSNGDGRSDEIEYLICLAEGKDVCP